MLLALTQRTIRSGSRTWTFSKSIRHSSRYWPRHYMGQVMGARRATHITRWRGQIAITWTCHYVGTEAITVSNDMEKVIITQKYIQNFYGKQIKRKTYLWCQFWCHPNVHELSSLCHLSCIYNQQSKKDTSVIYVIGSTHHEANIHKH